MIAPNNAKVCRNSPVLSWFRKRLTTPVTCLLLGCFTLWSIQSSKAATLTWVNGSANWDTTNPFWNPGPVVWNNATFDTALFTGAPETITLSSPISAGGLIFNSNGYGITGDTLTLGNSTANFSPVIRVNGMGFRSTIESVLAGSLGFVKDGTGNLALTNASNTYTGGTAVKNGTLFVSNLQQLGASTSTVAVTGISSLQFGGGTLHYDPGLMTGVTNPSAATFSRNLSIGGRGSQNIGAALITTGFNTFSGNLLLGSVAENRVITTAGITTVTGQTTLGGSQSSLFYGNGSYIFEGAVTQVGAAATNGLYKTGSLIGSTMWLQNNNNSFDNEIRIDSGTVRAATGQALGYRVANAIRGSGGTLELRVAPADVGGFATKGITLDGGFNVFADHSIAGYGGTELNQNINFGAFAFNGVSRTFTLNGRNGYGITMGTNSTTSMGGNGNNNIAFTNNSNGSLNVNGVVQVGDSGAARNFTITATGNVSLNGRINSNGTGFNHTFTKAGTGVLTFNSNGAASTYAGVTTITGGTLRLDSIANVLGVTSEIRLGNATTTAGALDYTGVGETVATPILLNTTTAPNIIMANGSGPVVFNGTIFNTPGTTKTLFLGGSSTEANQIASAIPGGGTMNFGKIGAGTWLLSGGNLFTGTTTISNGILRLSANGATNIIPDASALRFDVDALTRNQSAGGTLDYAALDAGSTEAMGALTPVAGAGNVQITRSGTATGPAKLTFSAFTPSLGASLNYLNSGPGVNGTDFLLNVTGLAAGFVNSRAYFNGSNFAFNDTTGGVGNFFWRAPVYGTDAGFVTSGTALTAASHNEITGSFSNGAATVNSLRINGAQTLTLTGLLTVGGATGGGIIQTGGAGSITGTGVTTNSAGDMVIRVNGSADTLDLSAPISSTTTGGLTKNGAGTLTLNGAQAYTGATTINEGKVIVGSGSRLGGASVSNNNNLAIRQGATLDVNGNTLGVAAINGAGSVTNTGAAAVLTVGNNNQSGVFSGIISGNLGITKAGTGSTLSFTGLNTYTGPTRLGGTGTLSVNNLADGLLASGIGASSNAAENLVFAGGTLRYIGASAEIYDVDGSPSVSTDRLFTLAGSGTIDSSGTYGNLNAAGGSNNASLIFSNTGDVVFEGAGTRLLTLTGTSTGDNEMRVRLINNGVDALSLTKSGAGLWILNPLTSNTYTGTTTINGSAATTPGVLQVANEALGVLGLSSGSNLTLGAATGPGILQTTGTFVRALGTGANQVQIGASGGGFAASTAPLTVNLGGAGATINLGSAPTAGSLLVLSSNTALAHVNLINPINLGTAARTIQVEDNGNTGLDFAIASGVISGGAGGNLTKSGGGALYLGNVNTYVGNTTVTGGQLVVTSIGNSTGTISSSLGASGGSLIYNPGDADLNALIYVGAGETASRGITFSSSSNWTANRTYRLEASGSAPLVLTGAFSNTTRGDTASRTIIFELRGWNTDRNEMAMTLTNSTNGTFPNTLVLQKTDGGTWVVSGPNTYTGGTNVNSGFLGISGATVGASGTAIGTGTLTISNAGIFATNAGGLTIGNTTQIASNTTAQFVGQNSITITNTLRGASGNPWTVSNTLDAGATLTLANGFLSLETGTTARTFSLRGTGATVIGGAIQSSGTSATSFDIRTSNAAVTTLNAASTYTGTASLLGQGTLVLGAVGALSTPNFTLHGGVLQASINLTGASKLTNQITIGDNVPEVSGTNSIEFGATNTTMSASRLLMNNLSGGAKLTISSNITNSAAATLTLAGSGNTDITGLVTTGTGAQGLANSGTGTITLAGANNATGALTANRGVITLGGASGAWTAGTFTLNANGTLRLDNSISNNNDRLGTGAFGITGGTLDFIGNSTTEVAGVLTVSGLMGSIKMSGTGSNTLTFASLAAFGGSGAALDITEITSLGVNNKLFFTTPPALLPVTTGILGRVMIADDFATYNGTNGVVAFTGYNVTNDINAAAATDTMEVTASAGLTANRTINALKIDGSGITVGTAGRMLTLTAGSIINTGGDNTLTAAQIGLTNQGLIQVESGTTLDVNGSFTGIISKAGAGTLTLNSRQFYNSTTNVSGGMLELNGGLNTLFANGAAVPGALQIDVGATVNLNGNTQYVGAFNGVGSNLPGSAGTLTTSSGTPLFVFRDAATFAGQITGTINLGRVGTGTYVLSNASSVAGSLTLMGGTTRLQDDGTLLGLTGLDINYATFELGNNQSLQIQNNNRIHDTMPIYLRGGTLSVAGRVNMDATETFGVLTSSQGANTINLASGGTGTAGAFASAEITFSSLTRSANTTLNFTGGGNLGTQGNNTRIFFATAPSVVNSTDAMGAWAIHNSSDFAAYNTAYGVGAIGMAGFTPYVTQGINAANVAPLSGVFAAGAITDINAVAASSILLGAGTTTTDMLRLSGGATLDLNFQNAGDTLNLALGGLLRSNNNNASSIGSTASRGILTSGLGELVVYNAQNTLTINSVIDGATKLIKSGAGTMTLTAPNTYSLGTVVSQGTVNISPTVTDGSVVVIPAGGLTLNGGVTGTGTAVNSTVAAGAIAASTALTMNGRTTLTYGNAHTNTLNSITINNNGGEGAPTLDIGNANSVLNLTTGSISATSSNAATTAIIQDGILRLASGGNAFSIAPIAIGAQTYTANQATLIISSVIADGLAASSITKTGNGLLQLSGQSTFSGGLTISAGGLVVGASSNPTFGGSGLISSPLGTGSVTFGADNLSLLVDNTSRSVANNINFFDNTPTFENVGTTASTLTLSGTLNFGAVTTLTPSIPNPSLTVALLGPITNIGSMTSITRTGLGTLVFNATGYTGDFDALALGNGLAVSLLHDGLSPNVGNGNPETINLAGDVIFDTIGTGTITVNRAGGSLPFNLAANKIISPASINTVLTNGLIVANTNGYGLQVADAGALVASPSFTVNTATASNVTQGLYMAGALSGSGFVKAGPGTMVLGNATNTFTGNVNINNGVVSVSENAQLGNVANIVLLNPQTGTATLRATDSFSTSRLIQLSNTTNARAIEVVGGETLTLTSAFDLNAGAGATASLIKADNGTLLVDASNAGWSGALNINAGAVLVNNNTLTSPLGTGTIFISPGAAVVGAALQLAGGVTINNPLNLQGTNNLLNGGINFQGQLDNVSGTNTYAGAIAMPFDSTIGARAGSTLNITGLITATGTHRLQFNAEGNINVTGGETGVLFGFDKYGAGTLTITSALFGGTITTGGVKVEEGILVLSGAGTTNSNGAPNIVYQGATLRLDNSGTNTNNRLTARAVTLQGGTFDFIANNSTETAGAFISDQGANTINNGGSGTSALTFASYAGNAGSSLNITGTFGTATNFVKFTTPPALTPVTTGILNRVTVNGNELASYNATNGIVAFTGYSPATNILSAGAAQTFNATPLTANSLTGNQTLNALTLSSGGGAVNVGGLSGLNPTTLTLTSGTILANGSGTTSTLSVPVVAFAATEAIIHVANGQTLNVTSGFSGTGGLSKNLPGTLNFNAQQFVSGATYVNGGTLNLQAGATNTLLFNNAVAVNAGGTLDLNGGSQFIAGLSSASAGSSAGVNGGIVTNSAVTQSTLTLNSSTSFAGEISGNIYLNKTGTGGLNLQAPQTYTGATLITGGTLTLADFATLPNTTQPIDIRYGTLALTNSALTNHNNRVNDLAPINLSSGTLNYGGRAQMDTTESLGAVSLLQGNNNIFVDDGNAGLGSAVLTLASITQTDPTATLRFNNLGDFGLIGTRGRVMITTNPSLANNLIGPWAIIDREYASYDATYGVGGLNAVGFAGYAGSGLNTNPLANDNVRHTATGTTVMTANTVVNTLNLNQTTSNMILDLGGNTLRLQGGGLLIGQNTDSTSVTINNGTITSGTVGAASDFFVTHAPYSNNTRAAIINAVIADNAPVTGPVRLILSAGDTRPVASGLTLGGVNTYTGGTVLNQSTIILGATGALGTGGITVNGATLVQTAGGVIPAQALTMNGGSVVTLAGANSLTGITFNNNGGAAPTLNPTGVLTLTGGIASNPTNPGTVSTISNGTLDLNGAGSYSINVAATLINSVDVAPWQAGLIINSAIQNGAIVKTGAGVLQLGGASTFAGGLTVNAGGLIIATDTNSLILNDPVATGPVGTGTLTMAANTTMLAGGAARTITNNVTFLGDSVFNGTNNLTLNGITTLPSVWNATVTAPQMTVTIGDASPSLGTDVINKSGLGILTVGNYAGTINASGGLLFSDDGNTLGTPENVSLGGNLVITGDTAITVNRTGSGPNSRNKTLQKVDLTVPGNIMSVSNQSGYGLEFTGNTLMTGPSHFAVGVATASNVVQGLILSGVVDDGASTFGIIKSGPGTLVLSGANTFGGVGQTIDILNGVLSVNSDAALGNAANTVTLNVDGSTGVGFRSTGTFSTGRTFLLNQANNAFEVTAGNNLTLTTPFTLSAASNTLSKNDNGIFTINADNTGWTGAVTINAGALRAADPDALGSGTVTINNATNSALQLTGGITFASPIIAATNGASGFNTRGVIESVSGINTISSLITQNSGVAATFGASGGATLNINGNIATANTTTFMAGASSTVNLNSVLGNGGTAGVLNKIGSGDLNVTVNQPAITGAINVNQGTMNVTGSGVTLGSTGLISINASGILEIDDSAGAASTHLGNRAVTIRGGEFIYTGNSANSAEVNTGVLTFARMGGIFASNQTGAGTVSLTFASLAIGADATANFQGVNLGTATNKILFTTAPTLTPATTGILARASVNGADFATYGANGIAAFSAYQNSNNPNTAAATDTMNLTANAALTANRTLNAVKFNGGTAITLGGAGFNQLVLTSGGILATGSATHVLSVPVLNNAAVQNIFHVDTGSTLNVTSTLVGTAGLVKDGAGTLILSPTNLGGVSHNTLSGVVTVARGTLQLAGGTNTIAPNQFLVMGGPASTLDLNGTSQLFSGVLTDTANPGSGGIITSNAGTGQLVINQDNTARNWAGSINGTVNLVRSGQNTLSIVSDNAYTGTTIINGGTTTLRDDGALSGTSAISINYATLSLENNVGFNSLDNRVNDGAPITLRGGTINFQGRSQTASTELVGAVTLAQGNSFINSVVGGTGINSADLTLTSLTRAVGGGTINFTAATGGLIGSSSRILIPIINGVSTSTAFNALNDGILGGWAVIGTSDWASYVPGLGVGAMGQQGFAQYSNIVTTPTTLANSAATDNVNLNTASITSVVNDDVTINSLRFGNVTTNTVNIAAGKTLTLESGGLLFFSTAAQNLGAVVNQGALTSSGPELFVYTQGTGPHNINSVIIGTNTLVKSGGNTLNLAATNTYTGGTTVNQGTLTVAATGSIPLATVPANGLVINNGTVTLNAAGGIASGNIVTLRSAGSILNLFGDNTLEGLVLYNTGGGSANLQINTFSTATATGAGSNGALTIGDSGIVASSENVSSANIIVGRTDFGATAKTVQVNPLTTNGVITSPLNSTLQLQGIVGTDGGIIKTGNGVLQFNAQAHYSGPTTVNAGGIRTGVTNGGSRLSALTLNGASTSFNLAALNTTWGSLAGSGVVFNSGAAATLTVGFDDSSTTFSGQLARFNDAVINGVALQKIGLGTMTMTSAQSYATGTTGTITVNGGTLKYMDAGAAFPGTTGTGGSGGGTFTVNNGGLLALDNTGTSNVNNRLGLNAVGTLNLQGGKLTINGTSTVATPTSELITTFNVTNGGGRVELTPDAANPLTLTITTLSNANNHGSLVVGGIDGSAAGTAGKGILVITTPALISGQGTGGNGTVTMGVRHDILGDASATGLGTGFLVRDSVGLTYRALAASELAPAIALPLTVDVDSITAGNQAADDLNVGLVGVTQALNVNSIANTLTISGTSTVNSGLGAAFGNYSPGGGLLGLTLSNASASLTLAGATGNINVGNFGSTSAGTTIYAHVIAGGTLNVNSAIGVGNTGGLAKADGGTMNLNNRAYYTGTTTINNGTLSLNSGTNNTLTVIPTAGGATVGQVSLNGTGSVLDLMGRNQAIGVLTSVNPLPGNGGTVQNTGSAATLTNIGTGTFSGSITGNISFTRAGNSTTTLTNANTYTGATVVRGGVLELRDSGTLASTAGLMLNYGTLNWNNFGLNAAGAPNPTRIAATNAVTLQGGTFTINGAGSTDTIATLNSVTVTGGNNFINTLPYINEGSTVKLTIGNLVRNVATKSGVVFNGFTTNNSTGSNTLGGQGLTTNSNIFLNQVNGTAFSASNLVNNLIGGWAVADGSTFATYSNAFGVVAMGNVYGGFSAPAFTGSDLTSTVATGNYNEAGSGTTAITRTMTTGAKSANSWRIAQSGASTTITPVSGTTYSFGVGIITNNNQAVTIGAVDATNTLAGTGADLFFYINSNTTVVQPSIIGSAALISNGPATLSLRPQFASNTYSGGTFVNNGTTNLQAASGLIAIPGNLTITNGAVTMSTVPNQIAATSNVVINGGGSLTFPNYNNGPTQTLASLTFNNEGGAAVPTLSLGTPTVAVSTLILSGATPITSANNSLATTPTISTGAATLTALQFSDPNPVIMVNSGLAETGLTISATITQNANMLSLSKSGAGVLALSGANTFTTGFNLNQGGLMFGAGSTGTVPTITAGPVGTGTLNIAGGTSLLSDGTIRTIGNATTVNGDFTFAGRVAGNGVILSGAMDLGATGRIITVESPAVTSTISGVISSTATGTALTKAGAGTLVLSNATSNLGGAGILISGGILKNGIANALPNNSLLTINAGAGYDLNDNSQIIQQIAGAGFITNSTNTSDTLTVGGTSATDATTIADSTFGGVLTDNRLAQASSTLVLTKVGAGTLTLTGANTYAGATNVRSGTVVIGADNTLPITTTVNMGGTGLAGPAGNLDLTGFNQTIGAFNVVSDTASANQILIGAGKSLTITGNVLIGSATDATTTLLTATGAGTLNVTNPATGNNFLVGNHQGNQAEADFSGLAALNINVGGTVQVSSTSGTNLTGKGTMTLATTSTITAAALTVGGGGSYGGNLNQVNSLFLGAGVNTLNVDTINVGTGARDFGSVTFDGASGSIIVRAKDGVGRAAFNMGTTGGTTGVATAAGLQNTFDITGHNADLLLGAVAMGTQATRGDTLNNVFSFDTGTLDMTSLTMSVKTGTPLAGTHTVNSTLNLGGGTVIIGNIAQMGQSSTSDNKANATINVTGGNVTIGTGSGTAITMASAGSGTQATGLLNLTGGSTTVTGDIVKTGGAGTTSATVTVNGGLLDMSGKNIGTGSSTVVLNAQAGTLQNLNELNGGAVLTKTTGGTLIMQGVNAYTGGTAINAGILQVNSTAALGTVGTISFGGGTLQYTANNTTDYSSRFSTAASQAVSIDTNAQNVTFATALTSSGGTLAKTGAGTLILTAASTYSGTTTVNGGTLQVGTTATAGTAGLGGAGDVVVNAGGTLAGTGNAVNPTITGSVILGGTGTSLAVMAPGDTTGTLAEQNARMNLGGSLTLNASGQLQFQLTAPTYQDVDYLGGTNDALAYLTLNPGKVSQWNSATPGSHDFVNVAGALTINANRADSAYGMGTVQLFLNSYTSPMMGDVFNLIDWAGALGGGVFNAGTGFSSGGAHGDFDLPTLTGGLVWDTSAFASYGVVVVVPEPGRVLFLLMGLLALAFRRRR